MPCASSCAKPREEQRRSPVIAWPLGPGSSFASARSSGTRDPVRKARSTLLDCAAVRFIGDSPALPRVRLAAGQGRNFFRPAALLVAPAAKALLVAPAANLSLSRNAEGPKG